MDFEVERLSEGKRRFRQNLAARPIAEKLRLHDAMRERELAIRGRAAPSGSSALHDPRRPIALGRDESERARRRLPNGNYGVAA